MRRTIKLLVFGLFLWAAVYCAVGLLPLVSAQAQVDYKRDIEPIFAQRCVQCHGVKKSLGQLRLDLKRMAMKGGISGAVIIPGKSRESRLVIRLLGEGGEARMPMGGDPLKPEEIELVRRWIDQGAVWPGEGDGVNGGNGGRGDGVNGLPRHWAYIKPVQSKLPPVKNGSWARNSIDAFILARLEQEGLAPSAEASKETLLRRVYLDLIGLPPGIKEIDEFLADRSPDAYEKVVERLLASPHYGERWARPWLDLARYADSNGYEKDNLRVMWKYRDWVINALNQDMPFDRFTIEQIAGDMLPSPTTDQLIATGFHRNTLLNQEGGTDPEEQRYEVLVDRVNTTATVWLGSTLGCAQCHNHKYDPFTQKDYYRMYAIFENADYTIKGEQHFERYVQEPQLELPTPEQEARRKVIREEIAGLEKTLKTQTPALASAQAVWERESLAEPGKWLVVDPVEYKSTGGTILKKLEDKSLLATGPEPEFDEYLIRTRVRLDRITALRIEALTDKSLPRGGPGRDLYGHFILSTIEAAADGKPLKFADGNWDDGLGRFEARTFFNYDMLQVSDRPRGWLINATNDQVRMNRQAVFTLDQPLLAAQTVDLTIRLKFLAGGLCQGMGRLRVSVTGSSQPLKIVSLPASLKLVIAKPADERTEKEKRDLSAHFRSVTPLLRRERDRMKELQDSLKNLGIVTALIIREKPGFDRPSTWVRERGNFMNKGEKVYAGTPASLQPMPESAAPNRLGLARWLIDENNPLVARVVVNRAWEQFFGRGIVETSEDFGTQSQPPSHSELLDWLAVEFVKGGWSMKGLHRLIVSSAAYRQDSSVSPAIQTRDPDNRWLARGPRFRVEAEMVRDLSLAASGLLNRQIGGPSVMPPQPDGIWRNPYSGEKWNTSKGGDRYRRGLYTFIRRTSPYPAMTTFDATSREVCTVRRVRTNTPLQSLTLLNDEATMEMARALAKRMVLETEGDARARAEYGFRLCLTRRPRPAEVDRLVALFNQQLANFKDRPPAAALLLKGEARELPPVELAAWTIVANVLLNLDETFTKQ